MNQQPHPVEEIMYLIIGVMIVGGAFFWILEAVLNAIGIPVSWK